MWEGNGAFVGKSFRSRLMPQVSINPSFLTCYLTMLLIGENIYDKANKNVSDRNI